MKKSITILIFYIFTFSAFSQEWVKLLPNYYKSKDYEGGITLLEKHIKTPFVYRHLSNFYYFQLRTTSNQDEKKIIERKYITNIIEGGLKGDVCNKLRLFEAPNIYGWSNDWSSYRFVIENMYAFADDLKYKFPEINDFKYDGVINILHSFAVIFFNDLANNDKYKKQVLQNYYKYWDKEYCEYVPQLDNCNDLTSLYTAEAAKYGNFSALDQLWIEANLIKDKKIHTANRYNNMAPEDILLRMFNTKNVHIDGWSRVAARLSNLYITGDFGTLKNYIKAHAYKLIAEQNTRDDSPFTTDWGKNILAKHDAIKLPLEAELKAQELAKNIMYNKEKKSEPYYEYPLEDICQYHENDRIITPYRKQ